MSVLSFFAAVCMQESNASKMACIQTGKSRLSTCVYPLSQITCDFADFAYDTSDYYKCFVKFAPGMITYSLPGISGSSSAASSSASTYFKSGAATTGQSEGCDVLYSLDTTTKTFNKNATIFSAVNKTTSFSANSSARLSSAGLASALAISSVHTMNYCSTTPPGGLDAVTAAKNFLGVTLANTSSAQALTVQQQAQQQQAQATALSALKGSTCAKYGNISPYSKYCSNCKMNPNYYPNGLCKKLGY